MRKAVEIRESYSLLQKKAGDSGRWRFGRGAYALKAGLEQTFASDRLHGLIRALEALTLPEPGKTERQFVARCSLFAGPKSAAAVIRGALQEAYRMRCDVEHMHDWDRSLQPRTQDDCWNVALLRTRQIEELACAAYVKILVDPGLQPHFQSDAAIENFWQRPDDEIRAMFGNPVDISQAKVVRKYRSDGRADPTEWPQELFDNLQRKAKSA